MARSFVGDIAAMVQLLGQNKSPEGQAAVIDLASSSMGIEARLLDGEVLANVPKDHSGGFIDRMIIISMNEAIKRPFKIDSQSIDRHIKVSVQIPEGVLEIVTNRKRLFSSTTYIFVLWMVGTSMILFGVATIFMRNQVRPIRKLASAADDFGKGRDTPRFKPEGATEVRQAASAFIAMRDRIQRQISQRTGMLSGVSHDLRTPLTRMRLQIEMLGNDNDIEDLKEDLKEDITDMEHMLEAYLAFARGEGDEKPQTTNLSTMLEEIVGQSKRNGAMIDLHSEGEIISTVKPNSFKRCVTNLVENANRYADHVSVRAGPRGDAIEITVDDDGPGIPEAERDEAFKPFYRLENSRNPETGGVGLGLTITRDVIRSHGGDITLGESPAGGLRAKLILPL